MIFRMVYKSGQIFLPFCHNSRVWQTQTDGRRDRRTDRILIARPRLHYMQRGKNCLFTDNCRRCWGKCRHFRTAHWRIRWSHRCMSGRRIPACSGTGNCRQSTYSERHFCTAATRNSPPADNSLLCTDADIQEIFSPRKIHWKFNWKFQSKFSRNFYRDLDTEQQDT